MQLTAYLTSLPDDERLALISLLIAAVEGGWRVGQLLDEDCELAQMARGLDAAIIALQAVRERLPAGERGGRHTCSWCSTDTPAGTRTCAACGHRADRPRLACDCAPCRVRAGRLTVRAARDELNAAHRRAAPE